MRIIGLLFLLCLPVISNAVVLHAEARADAEQQARKEALAALAESILIEVRSEFSSNVQGNGKRHDELRINSHSDIPLIGVDLSCSSHGKEFVCDASLDSGKSLPIYTRKLVELSGEIGNADASARKADAIGRYPLLVQELTLAEQYEKYRAVAQMLGDANSPAPIKTRADIQEQLRRVDQVIPTLDLAAEMIAKGLDADALYIYPAVAQGSHEVTAFGRIMRDKIAQQFKSGTSLDKATHYLKGEYELLDNSLQLTYRLLDDSGNTLATRIATLAPVAYKGLQTKPTTIDFDRLLHEGVSLGNDFRAQLNSSRGSEDVLFDESEEIELFVKLSRPGYFYVVGHVLKQSENFSYLLELSEAERDRRFIRYVNADDVNKWLSIGRFEAAAPFGIESLQLISSNDDPINRLPMHPKNQELGLYVTATNAQQGITKTRALKPKRTEGDQQYQAEAVLMLTTMPKSVKE